MSQLQKHYEDISNGIIRPQLAPESKKFDAPINGSSAEWQRQACVQIRRYQSRECQDGMSMDTSPECWENVEVWPMTETYYPDEENNFEGLIGAIGFEKNVEYAYLSEKQTVLQFCWIHPFHRNKGLLKKQWPKLLKSYGPFLVSPPKTNQMQGFLKSVGYSDHTPKKKEPR